MGNYPTQPPSGDGYLRLYINYYVYFRTNALLEANIATLGNWLVNRSPAFIRDTLGVDETKFGWQVDDADIAISFPYPPPAVLQQVLGWGAKRQIRGTYVYPTGPNGESGLTWWPPLSYVYDYDQDWFIVPGNPDVPIWGPGRPIVFVWTAMLLQMGGSQQLAPAETPAPPSPGTPPPPGPGGIPTGGSGDPGVPYTPIMSIRWGMGFEINSSVSRSPEGINADITSFISKDASRVPGDLGLAVRSLTNIVGDVAINVNGTVSSPELSWERFYIRLRRLPTTGATNDVQIIGYLDSIAAHNAASIRVTSTGALSIWMALGGGAATLKDTGAPLNLDQWYCVDVFIGFADSGVDSVAGISIYVGRVLYAGGSQVVEALANGVELASTRIGNGVTGANDLEYDLDDYFNADAPQYLSGPDFLSGTHFSWIKSLSLDSAGSWAGQYPVVDQILGGPEVSEKLISNTSADIFKFNTLLNSLPMGFQQFVIQQGIVSFQICGVINNVGSQTNGAIGYDVNGAGNVLKTVLFEVPGRGVRILNNFSEGENMPLPIDTLAGVVQKSSDGNTNQITQVGALIETIGSWGPEDDINADSRGVTAVIGIHNGPFIGSLLSYQSTIPIDEVAVETGSYIGNGTIQTFTVNLLAVHWLYIRRVSGSGTTGGVAFWYSSMLGPHKSFAAAEFGPNEAVSFVVNEDGTTTITLFGSTLGENNISGDVYQYIAFCDITSKLFINGAFAHAVSLTTAVNNFFIDTFLPAFAFLMPEYAIAGGSSSTDTYLKGPANSVDSGTGCNEIVETANVATFGTGSLTSRANLHQTNQTQTAYSVWRTVVSDDFPLPLYIGQYTGDGTGARTLSVDFGGRRPLFAIIQGVNLQVAVYRDPAHTGVTSGGLHSNSSLPTDHIVGGGIDQILIGANLNTNLRVYNVFAIPGGTDACNNGWSCDGTYVLIPPGEYPPTQYLPPPDTPPDVGIVGAGGIVLSGEPSTLIVKDLAGIYEIIPGQHHDTILTRNVTDIDETEIAIPRPFGKTGYIGG